jgi:hypothetical protein
MRKRFGMLAAAMLLVAGIISFSAQPVGACSYSSWYVTGNSSLKQAAITDYYFNPPKAANADFRIFVWEQDCVGSFCDWVCPKNFKFESEAWTDDGSQFYGLARLRVWQSGNLVTNTNTGRVLTNNVYQFSAPISGSLSDFGYDNAQDIGGRTYYTYIDNASYFYPNPSSKYNNDHN